MNKFSKKSVLGATTIAAAAALVAGFAAPAMAASNDTTSGSAHATTSAGGASTVTPGQLGALENLPGSLAGQWSALSPVNVSASVTVGTHTSTLSLPGGVSSLPKLPALPSLPSTGSLPSVPTSVSGAVTQLTNTLGLGSLLGSN